MRRVRIKKNETYVVKFENLSSDGAGIGRIGVLLFSVKVRCLGNSGDKDY